MRMGILVHMYAYAYVCMYIYMCIFFAVGVACTLEQVFWAPVHVQLYELYRCFFDNNAFICDTFTAGCAHMCICIYMCICMHMYMDACVILFDASRRCCWDFMSVYRCACTCMCICVCMYACICACAYACIFIYVSVYMYAYTCICTRVWVYICTRVDAFCLFVLSNPSTTCVCITDVFSTSIRVRWGIGRWGF